LRTTTRAEIGRARMTYLQGECSYRRADSVRRFNVGRVSASGPTLSSCQYPPCRDALAQTGHRDMLLRGEQRARARVDGDGRVELECLSGDVRRRRARRRRRGRRRRRQRRRRRRRRGRWRRRRRRRQMRRWRGRRGVAVQRRAHAVCLGGVAAGAHGVQRRLALA